MANGDAPAAAETPPREDSRKHVAVVFFHGIGRQRRYETTAYLLEALDDWVFASYRARDGQFPQPRLDIRTRSEELRADGTPDGATIVYQQADYQKIRVRFYEGYWAPATVMGTSAGAAFVWLMRQLLRPITVLWTPWRSYARLRRGDLFTWSNRKGIPQHDVRRLVNLYRHFVAQRQADATRFADFLEFIRKQRKPEEAAALLPLAQRWYRWHIRRQWSHLALLAFIGLSLVAILVLLLLGVLALLAAVSTLTASMPMIPSEALKPDLKNAFMLLSVFFGAVGVRAFLRDYIGDVQQFVTYEEVQPLYERRQKILSMGTRTLSHVLKDPQCERVVIVAHSLGTAVALDAVLQLRSSNQASAPSASAGDVMKGPLPLGKIQHFITCGSPIDKINYFFAALRSGSRSYESVIEALRGDITTVPFSGGGRQPYIHWINFWDRGDPISGPIETVAGDLVRDQRVDNVQVCSFLWPDPAASHDGYLRHREMMRTVFASAFFDAFSFANYPHEKGKVPNWPWIGPGANSLLQNLLLLLLPAIAFLLIWTAAALVVRALPGPPITALGVVTMLLIAGVQAQRRLRLHRATIGMRRMPREPTRH